MTGCPTCHGTGSVYQWREVRAGSVAGHEAECFARKPYGRKPCPDCNPEVGR